MELLSRHSSHLGNFVTLLERHLDRLSLSGLPVEIELRSSLKQELIGHLTPTSFVSA